MKLLQKLLSQLLSPLTLGLLIAVVVSILVSQYYKAPEKFETVTKLNQLVYDWRLKARGSLEGHPDIAILAIDDRSLQQEGRWPWPRQKVAELIRRTTEAGAKLVAFDMVFSEEDPNSSRSTLIDVQSKLQKKKINNQEITEVLEEQISSADSDLILGNTVKSASEKLVMGAIYESPVNFADHSPTSELCYNILARYTAPDSYWRNEELLILTPVELKLPDPLIQHVQKYLGDVLEQDVIKGWLADNQKARDQLNGLITLIGDPLTIDLVPVLIQYWLSGKLNEVELPEPANSMLSEGLADIFILSRRASLTSRIDTIKANYCSRFFTQDDELLSEAAYVRVNDSSEGYEDHNLAKAWPEIQAKASELKDFSLEDYVRQTGEKATHSQVLATDLWRVNIPKIASNTKHTGFFNAFVDNDGVIRNSYLFARYGEWYIPSLALKSLATLSQKNPAIDWRMRQASYFNSTTKSYTERKERSPAKLWLRDEDEKLVLDLPIDSEGKILINYAGPQKSFPHINAADILSDEDTVEVKKGKTPKRVLKEDALKDKILLLGPTAMAIFDMRTTPFEENYPGVETHANVLSNLLIEYQRANNQAPAGSENVPGFLRKLPSEGKVMPFVLLILGAIVAFAISYFGSVAGLLITTAILTAIYLVDRFLFFDRGFVISAMFPAALTLGQFVVLTFHKYFTEERKKRELKGVFEKYVSPSIVAEVLSHPENLELGGRKQDLTVMFSDVRGFTTISEKLDPRELSRLLSNYLTPMTQLVFKNKGTLDKYMGDAIMAFFGAPVKYPDNAKWACRCALEMLVKLKELQALFKSQGLPEIDIGIGLNTGEVSVGNMGSDTVQSYTVMGDAVNLGSRLEGINKEYGTRIVISEFTQKALGPEFATRELDWVKVKGKLLPVKIFELVGEGKIPEQTSLTLQAFAEGFSFYHKQQWTEAMSAFEKALSHTPNDPPSELYIERCQEYLVNPPPSDWDGVFTMTTK